MTSEQKRTRPKSRFAVSLEELEASTRVDHDDLVSEVDPTPTAGDVVDQPNRDLSTYTGRGFRI